MNLDMTWGELARAAGGKLLRGDASHPAGSISIDTRTLQPGEIVALNGALPLRFKIGNAAGTELLFRSQPVNLAAADQKRLFLAHVPTFGPSRPSISYQVNSPFSPTGK